MHILSVGDLPKFTTRHKRVSGQTCSNGVTGIENIAGDVCCPLACNGCGGSGCDVLPLGYDSCCSQGVRSSNVACGVAPCIIGGTYIVSRMGLLQMNIAPKGVPCAVLGQISGWSWRKMPPRCVVVLLLHAHVDPCLPFVVAYTCALYFQITLLLHPRRYARRAPPAAMTHTSRA